MHPFRIVILSLVHPIMARNNSYSLNAALLHGQTYNDWLYFIAQC
jgi:hypothetical protein